MTTWKGPDAEAWYKKNLPRHRARNRARYKAEKEGRVKKGDGKELDHVGYHPYGSLDNVPTKVTTRRANRKRQPPDKKDYGPRKKK